MTKVQEQAAKEQAGQEQAAKEQAAKEQAAQEQAAKEQAAQENILSFEEFKVEIEKLVCAPQILPNLDNWYKAYKKDLNNATNEKK